MQVKINFLSSSFHKKRYWKKNVTCFYKHELMIGRDIQSYAMILYTRKFYAKIIHFEEINLHLVILIIVKMQT